jgi:hypothetical protein
MYVRHAILASYFHEINHSVEFKLFAGFVDCLRLFTVSAPDPDIRDTVEHEKACHSSGRDDGSEE